jgi:hypothetical protein
MLGTHGTNGYRVNQGRALDKRDRAAIAECLGHVSARDTIRAFEIGKGAGDPQNPVVAPRRETQPFDSPQQQGPAGGLRACDLIE